ncbi:MAG: RNA polymerase sigma factor [Candidatus Limnocylindrales bacterium]
MGHTSRRRGRHRLLGTDELVHSFIGGDMDALDELVRRHRQVPLGAARRHLRSSAEVEDVAQETWFRFTLHAADIREPAHLASWLWVTAANEARRQRRRADRQRLVDSFDDLSVHQPEDRAFTTSECRAAVRRAVCARLNDGERELLALLMDARGLDYRQISRVSVRPVGGIGPTRARIIRKLQSHPDVARLCGAAA